MEYAFQGFTAMSDKKYWADAYPRLGDARRAAKDWVNKSPSKHAVLMHKVPMKAGHELGAEWKEVGIVKWKT